ncbi:MAG: biotin/lipoate A/B protein ligase family protein [Syntrophales bacterium]|nr:biotin/lipoate A/B protein ligase family protein [Syntrophales bacterium]
MKTWRLLDTGVLSPACNMAVDRALLALHANGKSPPTLRLYQWQPPAVSLGYFQKRHDLDQEACRRLGFEVVRRPTGGRAVLHLEDLTYAVIAGTAEGMPSAVTAAYHLIAQGLLHAFHLLGIEAKMGRERGDSQQTDICFLRCARGAIVYQKKKLVGSAQTWHASSLLQHGSIIVRPQMEAWLGLVQSESESPEALRTRLTARLTSMQEILGWTPKITEIKEAVRQGMAQTLGVELEPGDLSAEEWTLARDLANQEEEENRNVPTGHNPGFSGKVQGGHHRPERSH